MPDKWKAWLKPTIPAGIMLVAMIAYPWPWWGRMILGAVVWASIVWAQRRAERITERTILVREAETALRWLSRLRHDWLNEIQVLLGYCSMNKTDRVRPYLLRLAKELEQERSLSQVSHPLLAVALIQLRHQAPGWRWQIEFRMETSDLSAQQGDDAAVYLENLAKCLMTVSAVAPEDASVRMVFDSDRDTLLITLTSQVPLTDAVEVARVQSGLQDCTETKRNGENEWIIRFLNRSVIGKARLK
ncbi:Spo0B domain-containing protein [Polycladomyces subterraneus]|uniref:Spo0B domain-containing protein n=1 Tax=Polycladomyces subterraneus TaxID=1016997 RepID=A0ABT8IMF1_9BACL|nr:Spo0B domain-containing protein [Polycladomyces subterraneus]MDN4593922.1 Spo0B domain-containing protein [Polycladomyces subterraneus]